MNDTTGTKGLTIATGAFTGVGMAVMISGIVLFTQFGGGLVDGLEERLGEVLMNRGIRYEAAGQFANAREAYSRALEQGFHGPQNRAMTCKRLGTLYWNEGQYDAAFTYLHKAAEFNPPIISAFEPLADSYIQLLRVEEATRVIKRWIESAKTLDLPDELAKAHYHRGRAAALAGDTETAIEAFETALMMGESSRSLPALAITHYEAGHYSVALDYIDRYLDAGGGPRTGELRDLRRHAEWKRDGKA